MSQMGKLLNNETELESEVGGDEGQTHSTGSERGKEPRGDMISE